ncbi:MAG: flagellar biosynthesis anti-sigma factor FlgM [Desulfovibrionales bacterium]|nr:flagellar biosynthesis anti-sigma factor FlgM [Desulfovibrionales bacterium]
MEIKNLLNGLQTYEQSKINKGKNNEGAGVRNSRASSDKVTLSENARLHRAGFEQAMNAEEVRTEKVQELKTMVQDGTYKPDSRNIAQKMIQEDLESWFQRT